MKTEIQILKKNFNEYIKLLMDFAITEKGEMNDFYQAEEGLREKIIDRLNKFKEDFF